MALRKVFNNLVSSSSIVSPTISQFSKTVVPHNTDSVKPIEPNVVRTKLSTCEKDQYNYILKCLIKMSNSNHKNLKIAVEGNIASGKSSIIRYLQTKFEMPAIPHSTSIVSILDDLNETVTKSTSSFELSPRKPSSLSSSASNPGVNHVNIEMDQRLNVNLKVLTEPVNLWRDLNGTNLLDLMYAEPIKWAYPFHSYVQLTMLQNHLEMAEHGLLNPRPDEHFISIMERSIFSARYCFLENLLRNSLIKPVEYELLDRWFNFMVGNHNCNLDLIFYLRTKPETCMSRLHKRARHEETRSVSLDYLTNLHQLHEKWLNHGDCDFAAADDKIAPIDSKTITSYYKPSNVIIIDADQSIDQVYKAIESETRNAVFMAM